MPDGWAWVRINTACIINPRNNIDDNTEVSFVPMANISEGYANSFVSDSRLWRKVKTGYTHFAENDIGIAKITPCFENKKSVVFTGLINGYGAGTTELHIIRTISGLIVPEYLLCFAKRNDFILGGVQTFSGDVGQQRVTKDYIANYLFSLPPLNEQKQIISGIKEAYYIIENIEKTKLSLIEDVNKAKSKILDLAIRGKLVPQNPNDEPASVLLERIRAEKEELIKQGKIKRDKKESVIFKGDDNSYYEKINGNTVDITNQIPFDLPAGWAWDRLGNIVSIARGGSPRPIKSYLSTEANGVNWIKIGDAEKNGKYIFTTKEKIKPEGVSKSRYVKSGDFLLTNSMSFGRPYILKTDGCIHDGWLVIGNTEAVFNQDYLYYSLSADFMYKTLLSLASGSTVDNLNSDLVKSLLFPIPPLKEQSRIAEEVCKFENILSNVEASLN